MRRVLLALAMVVLVATPAFAGGKKIEVCHDNQVIAIQKSDWDKHKKHGDFKIESKWDRKKCKSEGTTTTTTIDDDTTTTTTVEATTTTFVEETTTTMVEETTTTSIDEETTTTPVVDNESSTTTIAVTPTTKPTDPPTDPPPTLPDTGVEDWLGQAGGALLLIGAGIVGFAKRKFTGE